MTFNYNFNLTLHKKIWQYIIDSDFGFTSDNIEVVKILYIKNNFNLNEEDRHSIEICNFYQIPRLPCAYAYLKSVFLRIIENQKNFSSYKNLCEHCPFDFSMIDISNKDNNCLGGLYFKFLDASNIYHNKIKYTMFNLTLDKSQKDDILQEYQSDRDVDKIQLIDLANQIKNLPVKEDVHCV